VCGPPSVSPALRGRKTSSTQVAMREICSLSVKDTDEAGSGTSDGVGMYMAKRGMRTCQGAPREFPRVESR
jgi:hypothetical protein